MITKTHLWTAFLGVASLLAFGFTVLRDDNRYVREYVDHLNSDRSAEIEKLDKTVGQMHPRMKTKQ